MSKSKSFWDDGSPVDREDSSFSFSSKSSNKFAARDAAVARQAERVLLTELLAIPGITGVRVEPSGGVALLTVTLTVTPADLAEVRDHLMGIGTRLRHAITASLRRRKAPELSFVFLPDVSSTRGGGQ